MAENVKAKAGTNGFDPDKVKSFVGRIEHLNGDMQTLKAEHMSKCKAVREDIKEVIAEAKDAGIPASALKALIKVREFERKAEAQRDNLDNEIQGDFDNLRLALGDLAETELGQAALDKAA